MWSVGSQQSVRQHHGAGQRPLEQPRVSRSAARTVSSSYPSAVQHSALSTVIGRARTYKQSPYRKHGTVEMTDIVTELLSDAQLSSIQGRDETKTNDHGSGETIPYTMIHVYVARHAGISSLTNGQSGEGGGAQSAWTHFAAQLVRPCSAALELVPPWPTDDLYMLYLAAEQRRRVRCASHTQASRCVTLSRHTGVTRASHRRHTGVTRVYHTCHPLHTEPADFTRPSHGVKHVQQAAHSDHTESDIGHQPLHGTKITCSVQRSGRARQEIRAHAMHIIMHPV